MVYKFDGFNWLVRLESGERLMENLLDVVRRENITGAWLSGLGAARWVELGFYDLGAKRYKWQKIDKLLEITSLQGNISWDGNEPVAHVHGVFSDETMAAYGGHVKDLGVGGTCEILLHRWYSGQLTRALDEQTGLKLLDL
jgi:predicted DNA-binding protein with PD1-like motif